MSKFKVCINSKSLQKFLIILSIFLTQNIWAQQDVKFRVICDVKEISVGEEFQVAFRLEGARMAALEIPNFNNFEVMGPSSSVSNSYVNGRSTQAESKIYILRATKPGKYTIGAATVKTNNGKELKTQAFSINVVAQSNQNSNTGTISRSKGAPDLGNNILLEIKASNANPVVGEQVVLDWIIYTRVDIAQINLVKLPKADAGFIHTIDNIDQSNNISTINGKEYINRILHRTVIFPDKAGEITISEGIINVGLLDDLNDINTLFSGFSNTHNYRLSSKPFVLNVEELANTPNDFNGTVGDYAMMAHAENNTISSDDMLRVVIKVMGAGDLKQMSAPVLTFEDGAYEVFPPNVKEEFLNNSKLLGGSKTFEYMLTPLKVGHYPIKPVFSLYNTSLRDFERQDTILDIQILQGKNPLRTLSKAAELNAENAETTDKVTKKNLIANAPLDKASFISYNDISILNWFTALLIICIPILTYIWNERKEKQQVFNINKAATPKEVSKAVLQNSNKQLQTAATLMSQGKAQEFYTEILHALKTFIADKINIPFSQMNKINMKEGLNAKGINNDNIQHIEKVLNTCDMALYAGFGSNEDMQKLYEESKQIMSMLNKQIV